MRPIGWLLVILLVLTLTVGCAGERPVVTGGSSAQPQPAAPMTPTGTTRAESPGPSDRDRQRAFSGPARGLTPAQRRVDRHDPDQVATAFVVRLEAWDTALDRRPNDAVRRAVDYADRSLRSRLLAAEPRAAPGQRWNVLADHRGWTSVRTRLGGLGPEPTAEHSAVRAVTATPTDHGADGWTAFPGTGWTYIVTLGRGRQDAGWTVVGYTIQ